MEHTHVHVRDPRRVSTLQRLRGAAGSPFAELHPRVYITPSATANLFASFPQLRLHRLVAFICVSGSSLYFSLNIISKHVSFLVPSVCITNYSPNSLEGGTDPERETGDKWRPQALAKSNLRSTQYHYCNNRYNTTSNQGIWSASMMHN